MSQSYVPKEGDFFVCLSEEFRDVKIYQCVRDKDNVLKGAYLRRPLKGKEGGFETIELSKFILPLFPCFFSKKADKITWKKEFTIYKRIKEKIEILLYSKPGYSYPIQDTIKYLVNQGESIEDSEAIIKVLMAEVLQFTYRGTQLIEYIEFGKWKTEAENISQYYGSLADEIKVKSEKISLLVSHGQTVGNYREHILRELLKKYIPKKFSVATGFIEGISRQLDIIIYDTHNHAPTFIEGDLVVVRRASVRAIIEVKTDLTTKTLNDALSMFYDISRGGIFHPQIPVFKGIFAFDTNYKSTKSIAKAIYNFYSKPYFEEQLQKKIIRDVQYLFHEVTCTTVLDKQCLFSKYMYSNTAKSKGNVIPTLLSIKDKRQIDVQTSMFIALLFEYLDVDYNGKKSTINAYSQLYRSKWAKVNIEGALTPNDWFPHSAHQYEHDFKQPSIENRLKKLQLWFEGDITTTEFLKEDRKVLMSKKQKNP